MAQVAAVADIHFGTDSAGSLRPHLETLPERADLFLLGGDLTRHGDPAEAAVLAEELKDVDMPIAAVLGNHDYHMDREVEIRRMLEDVGVSVLEGESVCFSVHGQELGVAGIKGFGGGFAGACGSDFGEPEMKAYYRHTERLAQQFDEVMQGLRCDIRIALLHYSPIKETLLGERPEIYPWLGSYLFAEAIDRTGADLVLHGHAHGGTEKGVTPGGIPVRNVAQPVIRRPYNVFAIER